MIIFCKRHFNSRGMLIGSSPSPILKCPSMIVEPASVFLPRLLSPPLPPIFLFFGPIAAGMPWPLAYCFLLPQIVHLLSCLRSLSQGSPPVFKSPSEISFQSRICEMRPLAESASYSRIAIHLRKLIIPRHTIRRRPR